MNSILYSPTKLEIVSIWIQCHVKSGREIWKHKFKFHHVSSLNSTQFWLIKSVIPAQTFQHKNPQVCYDVWERTSGENTHLRNILTHCTNNCHQRDDMFLHGNFCYVCDMISNMTTSRRRQEENHAIKVLQLSWMSSVFLKRGPHTMCSPWNQKKGVTFLTTKLLVLAKIGGVFLPKISEKGYLFSARNEHGNH